MLVLGACSMAIALSAPVDQTVPPPSAGTSRQLTYLNELDNVWSDFPKGPRLASPVDEGDLAITLAIQTSRTEDQKAEAERDKKYSIKLVSDVIDPAFETKYPKTWAILRLADHDESVINSRLKKSNARCRPFVQHPTLVTPLFTVPDYSYPSGHASGTELQARILGKLFPTQANELQRRARQVADSRVVAGVHYTSDTEYGIELGDLVFRELEANVRFESDLEAAAQADRIPRE